jgi:DNA repair protein RadC
MPRRPESNPYQAPFEFPRNEQSFLAARDSSINRFVREAKPGYQLRNPSDAAKYFQEYIFNPFQAFPQEELWTLFVNNQNIVTYESFVYRGTINMIVIRPADVFRPAIQFNARAMVLSHNHPSGSAIPSPEDVRMTENLVKAGDLLDITILDHVICGDGTFTSLRNCSLGFS